jgi:hypothetical protein
MTVGGAAGAGHEAVLAASVGVPTPRFPEALVEHVIALLSALAVLGLGVLTPRPRLPGVRARHSAIVPT